MFSFTAAFAIGKDAQTTVLVPIIVVVVVLVAIGVFRVLQASAFRSIQLASTLSAVARRGREAVDDVYPEQTTEAPGGPGGPAAGAGEVRWAVSRRDAPGHRRGCPRSLRRGRGRRHRVVRAAGQVIPERGRVAIVHGDGEVAAHELVGALQTGIERTYDQDPTMALRVFADIALRALYVETVNGSDDQPDCDCGCPYGTTT